MGGVEVVGFVCGGVFVVRVVVVGFVLAIAVAVVGGVIVVVLFRRLFGLNLLRRCSRSANSFCSRVWGVAVVLSGTYGGGVVDGDGVGGIAGHAHSDLVGVGVGVLIGDGVGGTAGSAQRVDVGVLSGVGDGGTAGSAHKLDVGVLSGVGEGGTAGSAHRVASRLDVSSGGGVAARHVVCALAGGGVCSFPSSASIASSKNLSSPLGCFVALQWPKPPKRTSGLCCGMKSASELHSSAALSVVELSSLSSLKSDFAAIARPWCFSQCKSCYRLPFSVTQWWCLRFLFWLHFCPLRFISWLEECRCLGVGSGCCWYRGGGGSRGCGRHGACCCACLSWSECCRVCIPFYRHFWRAGWGVVVVGVGALGAFPLFAVWGEGERVCHCFPACALLSRCRRY